MTNLIPVILPDSKTPFAAAIPDLYILRESAHLLINSAYVAAADGRYDEAINQCTDAIRFANHLADVPHTIAANFHLTLVGEALDGFRAFPSEAVYSDSAIQEFQKALDDVIARGTVADAMESQLKSIVWYYSAIKGNTGRAGDILGQPYSWMRVSFTLYGSRVLRFRCDADQAYVIEAFCGAIEALRKPYYEAKLYDVESSRVHVVDYLLHPITPIVGPNFSRSRDGEAEAHARIRMALAALALRKYKSEHGAYPETLHALVPAYMPDTPEDPFTGKAMTYQVDTEGYTLYSAGVAGKIVLGAARRTTYDTTDPRKTVREALSKYRNAKQAFPETLDALVPDYLPVLPLDPATGKPLPYQIKDGQPDLGTEDPAYQAAVQDDIVWISK